MRQWYRGCLSTILFAFAISFFVGDSFATEISPLEKLGKRLFFDKSLSSPSGQSCAACHAPEVGFTGPDQKINETGGVYENLVRWI